MTIIKLDKVSPDAPLILDITPISMKSILNVKVSRFQSYLSKAPRTINLLDWLHSKEKVDEIEKLRTLADKPERDRIKATLPAVTISGVFNPSRKEQNLVKHSGLICIDIDHKGNEHIDNFAALKEELFNIENVAYAGLSASGKGFFLIIPITFPKKHKEHFTAISQDFMNLGLSIDPAPTNVASLRGYSWDRGALFRHNALPYKKCKQPVSIEKKSRLIKPFELKSYGDNTKTRVEETIQKIVECRIDITQNEPDWFRLACAFANEFGEEGRGYFHAISQFYPGYNRHKADQKFDHAFNGQFRELSISTFFYLVNHCLKRLDLAV